MSLEFKYLHRKSPCEMLISGDDIGNDAITLLGVCFSMFVDVCAQISIFCLVIVLLIPPTFSLDDILI